MDGGPDAATDDGRTGVEAVGRALALLSAFTPERTRLSLAELARDTGLHKTTILRNAATLERFGFLIRDDDGRFRLGPMLWRLGSIYRLSFDLAEHIRPELRALVDATGETASYYVREGDSRVCLYRLNSPRSLRHHLNEGDRLPLEGGASARVLLAFGDGPGAAGHADVRAAGHALSMGARDRDIAAISVPVLDARTRLRGALAVSGLITRFDEAMRRDALAALEASAARLRERLPA